MRKWVRVAIMFAFSLVVVASGLLAGCSSGQAELKMPEMEIFQYLLGTTVDFNEATLNAMAEGGGEAGFKFGIMKAIYPGTFESNKDAVAQMMFPPPYKILKASDNASVTTYAMLTSSDKQVVDGTIYATKLTQAEQDVVTTAVAGFFNRVDNDSAAAKTPQETSAYAILQGVSSTAADNWAADVAGGMDCADRFFVHLVKQYVASPQMTAFFADFWAVVGYATAPYPTDNVTAVEAVARMAGEVNFTNGTAGSMYPTQREEQAQALFGKAYGDLDAAAGEPNFVDAEVYRNLPSAFGTGAAADAIREGVRNGMAASLQPIYSLSSDNYSLLYGVEKALVDQAIGAQLDAKDDCGIYTQPLGFGPHLERDYVDFFAIPGAIFGWGAEMDDPESLEDNTAYLALNSSVSKTAGDAWKADVEGGVHPRQAYYRWLAKEEVSAMASASLMIQMSMAEFYVKVTNPNDYLISVDRMSINCQVDVSGQKVDAAKQSLGDEVWVPANESVIVRVLAPVKSLDMVTWAVLAGNDSNAARALASNVWSQVQAGTAAWTLTVEAQASNESGDHQTETYSLEWITS